MCKTHYSLLSIHCTFVSLLILSIYFHPFYYLLFHVTYHTLYLQLLRQPRGVQSLPVEPAKGFPQGFASPGRQSQSDAVYRVAQQRMAAPGFDASGLAVL